MGHHPTMGDVRHLYVHVPFCAHRCGYCDFVTVTGHDERHGAYVDALLRDLDRLLMEETGLPVLVAEDPLTCVVRGSGMALERMDKLGSLFSYE